MVGPLACPLLELITPAGIPLTGAGLVEIEFSGAEVTGMTFPAAMLGAPSGATPPLSRDKGEPSLHYPKIPEAITSIGMRILTGKLRARRSQVRIS